jgi:pimeloyl-ACP methyl ester carboxylesterase
MEEIPKAAHASAREVMTTTFAVSTDGTRIAYDVTGTGPALILLAQTRSMWHDAGYLGRLRDRCTIITLDLRGHGQSDKPADENAYAVDRLSDDVLAVADAAGVSQFTVWGYSYGATVGRYLPARSDRITKLAMIGVSFGAAAPGSFRNYVLGLVEKWTPIIAAHRAGTLDLAGMSDEDRARWLAGTIPATIAQLTAILKWPSVEPSDMRCPTLWVVGSANDQAMPGVSEYRERLLGTRVILRLLPGLTHAAELTSIDEVLRPLLAFTC